MSGTPDILKKILARKSEEIAERMRRVPLRELRRHVEDAPAPRGAPTTRASTPATS